MPPPLIWELSLPHSLHHPSCGSHHPPPAPSPFPDCTGSLEVVEYIARGTLTVRRLHLHSLAEVIPTGVWDLRVMELDFFWGGASTCSTSKEGQ